jgi:hypothetical protein
VREGEQMNLTKDVFENVRGDLPQIRFCGCLSVGGVDADLTKSCDVMGFVMKQWLEGWLKKRGVEYAVNPNSQMPPDFFLDVKDDTHNLLEIKAFNSDASPGFDIADFTMYSEEIIREPYMLDVDYLIFAYKMGEDGEVTIRDVWLKKVWEITRRMADWPLNLQVKKDVVHKIRPGVWYSKKPRDFKMFTCLEHFLSAMEETVYQNEDTRKKGSQWKNRFLDSYKKFYGKTLRIPKWDEIKDSYLVAK